MHNAQMNLYRSLFRRNARSADVRTCQLGLFELRAFFANVVPSDFEWYCTFNLDEIFAGWTWKRDHGLRYQAELRAANLGQFVAGISSVDWAFERAKARAEMEAYR